MSAATTYSRSELTRRTREILEQVRRGYPAVIESQGEEQAILLDLVDYRLLRALAALGLRGGAGEDRQLLERYLAEEISLGKVAEVLGLSRFELMERFERLGVPLLTGPADLDEARAEVAAARGGA